MPPPAPPVSLHDHCSIIYNNTLYVYSPDAFQSLPLRAGGEWTELTKGVSVTGAACVSGASDSTNSSTAMYIVGGSNNVSTPSYTGLQRYSFSESSWEMITPVVPVAQNRINHAAAYLNDSSSILIYAGSQDKYNGPSSQTFLISTNPPFNVQAFSSDAPPVIAPLLLPWNASHALMLGGNEQNNALFTFGPNAGWQGLNIALDQGLPDRSQAGAAIINGDDGSKVLETFDLSMSPNSVARVVLLGASGAPASSGQALGSSTSPSQPASTTPTPAKRRKRDLTISDWPPYNSSLAPTTTRTGFSLAQDPNGLVVMSGGNSQDPLSIFDQREDQWLNATTLFEDPSTTSSQIPQSSPTSLPATTRTSSAVTTSSAAATSGSGSSRSRSLTILGAVLGVVLGIIVLLVLLLVFLRWRRKRRARSARGQHSQSHNVPGDRKDPMDFADRGASFMKGAAGFRGHTQGDSMESHSSVGIISGKSGEGHKRALFGKGGSSGSNGLNQSNKKCPLGPISAPTVYTGEKGVTFAPTSVATATGPQAETIVSKPRIDPLGKERSSGWSKYFTGNDATNLAHMNSERSTYNSQSGSSHETHSQYSDSRVQSSGPHGSAEVPPLNFGRFSSGQDLNRVASSSPTEEQSPAGMKGNGVAPDRDMSAQISRLGSISTLSSIDRDDTFIGGIPAHQHEETNWTPVGHQSWGDRVPSSLYTESIHGFPLPRNMSATSLPRDSGVPVFPRDNGPSTFPRNGAGVTITSIGDSERDRSARRHSGTSWLDFDPPPNPKPPSGHSDMSWLNLGNQKG